MYVPNGVRLFVFCASFLLMLATESCNQAQKQAATDAPIASTPSVTGGNSDTFISANPLAAGLIRVGEEGINTGDDRVLDAYFSKDYVLHGPDGDLNLSQLKAYWKNLRSALTGFAITRQHIIVEGNWVGARSTFSGTFDKALKQSPVGLLEPTGKRVTFEVIGTFRYNEDGLLAEEWVQNDRVSFLKQFGVDPFAKKPN